MTAQISDFILYDGSDYALIGREGEGLPTPGDFGIKKPGELWLPSCCYRGFYSVYDIKEDGLFLKTMVVCDGGQELLPIADVPPERKKGDIGNYALYHLNLSVPFTGRMRLAKDFLDEFYIHMGYEKASAFETVYDLRLEGGRVVEIKDRSEDVRKNRGVFFKRYNRRGIFSLFSSKPDPFSLDMHIL